MSATTTAARPCALCARPEFTGPPAPTPFCLDCRRAAAGNDRHPLWKIVLADLILIGKRLQALGRDPSFADACRVYFGEGGAA